MEQKASTNKESSVWPERVKVIEDPMEFVKNKSSDNARKLCEIEVSLATHIWIDKHYHDRHQFGDTSGRREGINPEQVEALVKKSIPHLLFYGNAVPGFAFLNYDGFTTNNIRVVLQERDIDKKLNVVIEAHYTEGNKFEITVKTALCVDDFRLSQGQYAIEIQGDNSILFRKDNNRIIEVCEK